MCKNAVTFHMIIFSVSKFAHIGVLVFGCLVLKVFVGCIYHTPCALIFLDQLGFWLDLPGIIVSTGTAAVGPRCWPFFTLLLSFGI